MFGPAIGLAARYAELLAGPGVERGLIGPGETARLWDRHLVNCAAIVGLVPQVGTLVDLGSGAGLPGLVLAMLLPDVQVVLLEPMERRVVFLAECVSELDLGNVTVHRGRAEDAAGEFAADVVTARAVAPLDRLAALAVGLVRPGGLVLAIKGAAAAQEVARAAPVLRRLGARDIEVVRVGDAADGPAATVVRFTAGPARPHVDAPGRRPSAGRTGPGNAVRAGRRGGPGSAHRKGRAGGRRSPG
jgi:16S rRNA (guanine527-N7)-methyltransferase